MSSCFLKRMEKTPKVEIRVFCDGLLIVLSLEQFVLPEELDPKAKLPRERNLQLEEAASKVLLALFVSIL